MDGHDEQPWWSEDPADALTRLGSRFEGLSGADAAERLETYGENRLEAAKPPSLVRLMLGQWVDPMNLMLTAVVVISVLIEQFETAALVGLLVVANVVTGAVQQAKARKSVDALASMQVPMARVWRDGAIAQVPSTQLVPGDVVELEAGDIVPADGRVLRSATLETQEAALTGESAPIEKAADAVGDASTALGDRSSMVFQNTSVTRGTATIVVTTTGMSTEMGRIAQLLGTVGQGASPLQKELGSLTRAIGFVAWGSVALIVMLGLVRGEDLDSLLLVAVVVAISAIPTGLPTYVQMMLSWGAGRLTEAKAVVASLNDVETLGSTSAICSDKTGTLTLNQMTVREAWVGGYSFVVSGAGYSFDGTVSHTAGAVVEDTPSMAYAVALPNDATVSRDGVVVGDPTEAAMVVLAEKLGVDVASSRRKYPRVAEVPFDSDYKFMATFHRLPWQGEDRLVVLVKGAPDVIAGRCGGFYTGPGASEPIDGHRDEIDAEIARLSSQGLRTLATAVRIVDERDEAAAIADPMAAVSDLVFMGLVGIVDPLREEAKQATAEAEEAGITVRMITGDHAITAGAIGKELGLTGAALSGKDLVALSDEELSERLPGLSVFGRVTPQDKLRLVRLLQERGEVVAMTGDAVNDAAAIKQADVGVAMGSGAEVTKQAAKLVLTDDNFATLVHAVRLGRVVYAKVSAYITFQMVQLVAMLALFVAASILDINGGVAMLPEQVLILNFVVTGFAVFAMMLDDEPPGLMQRAPRDTTQGVGSRSAVLRWLLYGLPIFVAALIPLLWGEDLLRTNASSVPMTMAFIVIALGTLGSGLVLRRDVESGLTSPIRRAGRLLLWGLVAVIAFVEAPFLRDWLNLSNLTVAHWLVCVALAALAVSVAEVDKWLRRRRAGKPEGPSVETVTLARHSR